LNHIRALNKISYFISFLYTGANYRSTRSCFILQAKKQTERLVIAKIRALPEVRDFYNYVQKDKPDFIINPPSSTYNNCYAMQIGIDYGDSFRTHFWLLINPKTFQIYYEDFDDEGMQTITIQQWRHWRKRPNFNKPHKWVNGKLVVLKDQ